MKKSSSSCGRTGRHEAARRLSHHGRAPSRMVGPVGCEPVLGVPGEPALGDGAWVSVVFVQCVGARIGFPQAGVTDGRSRDCGQSFVLGGGGSASLEADLGARADSLSRTSTDCGSAHAHLSSPFFQERSFELFEYYGGSAKSGAYVRLVLMVVRVPLRQWLGPYGVLLR